MAKPKLNLKGLTPLQKIQKANDIVEACTGNGNFTTPNPPLSALTARANALSAAFSDREAARLALDEKQANLLAQEGELDATLTAFMAYVENASEGDAVKILSAAFEVRGLPTPVGLLPQVDGLDATIGDAQGVVVLRWGRVRGAVSYELQISPDPFTDASWAHKASVTKTTYTLTGLPSGGRCWFRVRAIGASGPGPGPWSDPAMKTVP